MKLKLYNMAHSSPSFRVRIALALKGLAYEYVPIDVKARGHKAPEYLARNPQGLLPALEVDGVVLTQSAAIIEWLEETVPQPSLFPRDAMLRARSRAIASIIATDIAPLHSMRVSLAVRNDLGQGDEGLKRWVQRFVNDGFQAIEAILTTLDGPYCCGPEPTVADIYLVPAVNMAKTSGIDVAKFPRLASAAAHASEHPAFTAAHPSRQVDA